MRPYPTDISITSRHVHADDLATCVACGLCLNDCPTYRLLGEEADSPRGRVQLIKTLVTSDGPVPDQLGRHLDRCLVCRACETACPSGVPFGRIMEGAREELATRRRSRGPAAALRRLGLGTIASSRRLGLASRLTDLYARSPLRAAARLLPHPLSWASSLAPRREGRPYSLVERSDADTLLFAGCIMRESFGDTERATVAVLESDGRRVSAPGEQACCGALHAHSGDGETARELARLNIDAFAGSDAPIVVNAAGCGAHLKAYGELLRDDEAWSGRARLFAGRVRDASESAEPRPRTVSRPLRVVYQDACHLVHGQRVRAQPRALLRAVSGVSVVEIGEPEMCCGSAGIYNLTHADLSEQLQRRKIAYILAARPDVVVSTNPGCMLQIRAGLEAAGSAVPVVHLMRFLADPEAFA